MYLCVQNYGSNLSRLLLQEYHSDSSIEFFFNEFLYSNYYYLNYISYNASRGMSTE